MPSLRSMVGWAVMATALKPALALDCAGQKDHKTEYTTNGKIYKVYCNSDVKPTTTLSKERNVVSAEACADLCAKRADCFHIVWNERAKICNLRPKETSIAEGAQIGTVATYGNSYQLVYDRDVPPPPPPPPADPKPPTGDPAPPRPDPRPVGPPTDPPSGPDTPSTDDPSTPPEDGPDGSWTSNLGSYDCTGKKDHKKWYYTNGEMYELLCDHSNPSGGYKNIPGVSSLAECADHCAKDRRCGSAEFHVATNLCELEPDTVPTPHAGYHLWVPKTCPSTPRRAAAVASPAVTTSLTCPMSNDKVYQGVDGTWYYVQCCTDAAGAVVKDVVRADSHKECVDKCSAHKDCQSVSFDHKSTSLNCKLFGPGGYSTAHKPGVTHLYTTEPPTTAPSLFDSRRCATECPAADGQIFASPTGENFVMSCKKRHGTTYLKATPDRYPSFPACMKACGATPACLSVDYEAKTQKCYFSTNSKQPTVDAPAFMSAHSAGCAGACKGCEGTTCADLNAGPLAAPKNFACTEHHGAYATVHGVDFRIACTLQLDSGPARAVTARDHIECTRLCALDSTCGGANFLETGQCYLHPPANADGSDVSVTPRIDADAFVKMEDGSDLFRAVQSFSG